jgi:hypothetical protein
MPRELADFPHISASQVEGSGDPHAPQAVGLVPRARPARRPTDWTARAEGRYQRAIKSLATVRWLQVPRVQPNVVTTQAPRWRQWSGQRLISSVG